MALWGLCCCSGFSLVVESGGYSLVVIFSLQWLLLLQSTGSRAYTIQQLGCGGSAVAAPQLQSPGSVALPRQGMEPISPALACGFFTTELLGKPWTSVTFNNNNNKWVENLVFILIHLFLDQTNIYWLLPGPVLDIGDSVVNKTHKIPTLGQLVFDFEPLSAQVIWFSRVGPCTR